MAKLWTEKRGLNSHMLGWHDDDSRCGQYHSSQTYDS